MTATITEAQNNVLVGLRLLGGTVAPKSCYEHVKNGDTAFRALVRSGHITVEKIGSLKFYRLSSKGHEAIA